MFTRLFLQTVLGCAALYLKGAHQFAPVLLPGRWSWTAKCWRWWTIKRSQTLKEAGCLRPNICSSPATRWPSSSFQMLKLQAASDHWRLPHGLHRRRRYRAAHHWTEVTWSVFILQSFLLSRLFSLLFSHDWCWAVLFIGVKFIHYFCSFNWRWWNIAALLKSHHEVVKWLKLAHSNLAMKCGGIEEK